MGDLVPAVTFYFILHYTLMLKTGFIGLLCLVAFMACGQTAEELFMVNRPQPAQRGYHRTVTIPDHSTCKESMVYVMDSNLIPGDTLKLELGLYTIGAYEIICQSKGEIFKIGGFRGVIDKGVYTAFKQWRRKPATELYLEITVLLSPENKMVALKNPWSYRLAW